MGKLTLDFTKTSGEIRPLHGVGQPPFFGMDTSMFRYLTEAGIPYSRLHDTGGTFGADMFVDVPNVFRDFNADPDDPASYDFGFTDVIMNGLDAAHVEPFYRLGVTIENYHRIKAYRIFPPADNLKWAKICAGIVRHYTRGWAGGYYMNIKYWEIWNEPDNDQPGGDNQMWKGTMEQYFELYDTAAKYLKAQFPDIHVGGFASCGFYGISDRSPRMQYFMKFFDEFLRYVRYHGSPLDFFSWHSYGDADTTVKYAHYARQRLDFYGFDNVEDILDEWNPPRRYELRGTVADAANVAAMFCALQNETTVSKAMYYDARLGVSEYGGMFDPFTRRPFPTYYAFLAWNELYKHGRQASAELSDGSDRAKLKVCAASSHAASGAASGAALIVNASDEDVGLDLAINGLSAVKVKRFDADKAFSDAGEAGEKLAVPAHTLALIYG